LVTGIDEARSFVGTEGFIAPEGPGTPQADLFALGKLLYEAATGCDRCDFPSLPEDLSQWPEHEAVLELNEVLTRACSPNPKLRHTNAAELAGDLNLLLAGRSIRRAYSVERRLSRIYRAAVAASVIALLAVGGLWFQRVRRSDAEQRAARELALRHRAEQAEAGKSAALRQALLEQARALVQSHAPDRRSSALAVLRQAAEISPGADLRTVAAAALATPELRALHSWPASEADPFGPAINPAADTYLRGDGRGMLMFHRVADDALLRTVTNGTSRVENSCFSADGRWLVADDRENRIRLWDLETGDSRALPSSGIWCLGFSSDSRFLYRVRSRGNLVRETLATGERTEFPPHIPSALGMALHPTLPLAVAYHRATNGLSVVSLDNGEVIDRCAHPNAVKSLAWHPAGNQLAAGCENGAIWIWDWPMKSTPRHLLRYHKLRVSHLSMHPNGRWLASSSWDGRSCLWDLESGQLATVLPGNTSGFSTDGTRLRLSRPGRKAVLEFDETFQPRPLPAHRSGGAPLYLAFSSDGQWLVTGGDDGAWLWDAKNWRESFRLTGELSSGVGVAANCSQVFSAGLKRWQAWELPGVHPSSGAEEREKGREGAGGLSSFTPAPLSPSSPAEHDARTRTLPRIELPWAKVETLLWAGVVEPRSGRWVSFEEPRRGRGTVLRTGIAGSDKVNEMFFEPKSGGNASISPDGRWTARGSWLTNDVWVIDLTGQIPPHQIAHRGNTATVFSTDSGEVVVGGEAEFRFVTLGTWRERLVVPREVTDSKPGRGAYSHHPGSAGLVALLISRSRVRLLRPADGREYLTLSTHEDRHIETLAFSPDDHYLVAASPDHHLLVWDLEALRTRLAALGLFEAGDL
jgi:WD40 repeat protein